MGGARAICPGIEERERQDLGRIHHGHRLPPQGDPPFTPSRKSAQGEQKTWTPSVI